MPATSIGSEAEQRKYCKLAWYGVAEDDKKVTGNQILGLCIVSVYTIAYLGRIAHLDNRLSKPFNFLEYLLLPYIE